VASSRLPMRVLERCPPIIVTAFLWSLNPHDLQAQRADLTVAIAQATNQGPIATGSRADFAVRVTNGVGQAVSGNVLVQVTIPPEFAELSATGTGFQCTFQGTVSSCTTTGLSQNQSKSFSIKATAPKTIRGTSQQFTLTAVVDPNNDVRETDNANNSDNLTVVVETRADLKMNVLAVPTPGVDLRTQIAPNLVFVFNVDNEGDGAASNLLTRSTLPKDATFVGVEANTLGICLPGSTDSSGALQVNCTLPSLAARARGSVRFIARLIGSVPDGVKVTFAANADPNNTVRERNETNNVGFLIPTVRAPSDLQLSGGGAVALGPVSPSLVPDCGPSSNNIIKISLTVRNNGPYRSAPTIVTAQWPAPIVRVSADISGVTPPACFDRCDVPALNSGQSIEVFLFGGAFDANISGPASATIRLDPAGIVFDPVVGNNSVTSSVCR
jgi:hypothetical protein